jgi:hypothetical protein
MARVEINAGGRVITIEDNSGEPVETLAARAFILWADTETDDKPPGPIGFSSERRPQHCYDASAAVHAEAR